MTSWFYPKMELTCLLLVRSQVESSKTKMVSRDSSILWDLATISKLKRPTIYCLLANSTMIDKFVCKNSIMIKMKETLTLMTYLGSRFTKLCFEWQKCFLYHLCLFQGLSTYQHRGYPSKMLQWTCSNHGWILRI